MPKFVTIGYGDRAGYERTPKNVREAAHAHDAELKQRGALMGVAGAPVQVRNASAAGVRTENSAFMSSVLPVAGFAVIDAADLAGGDQDRFANAMRRRARRCGSLALGADRGEGNRKSALCQSSYPHRNHIYVRRHIKGPRTVG